TLGVGLTIRAKTNGKSNPEIESGGPGRCPMLGRIKYLRKVRVEGDVLKRNKNFASTRTPLSLVRDERSQVQILPLRPAFFTIEAVTGNDMGNETVAQRKHFAPIDRYRSRVEP